jgi:murein DD-endopeptidase MepM/ murein hydrolase activator NlpD
MALDRLRREIGFLALALVALTALAACMRNGPPAPVTMGEAASSEAPQPSPRAPGIATVSPSAAPSSTPSSAPSPPMPKPAPAPIAATPAAPPAPPVAAPQSHRKHPAQVVVAPGETLYMISRRNDVPLRAIIDANHLEPPYRLAAGTRLDLPQTPFHIVQPGETLYAISRLYGVEVSTLARLNHLNEPFGLRAGQALDLPPSIAPPERSASLPPASEPETSTPRAPPAPPTKPAAAPAAPKAIAPATPKSPSGGPSFAWPLQGRILESYGTGPAGTHNDGINIAARAGAPVRAAEAGLVVYAGNELRGYGNLVLIKHRGGYMTAYAHNARLLVKRGERVKRGQAIATAGSTGSVRTPQLHFEIRQGTRALDPIGYLPALNASAN